MIHETGGAGYGWSVAASSPGENYALARNNQAHEPVTLQGWLHEDSARQLFNLAGLDLDRQRINARSHEFKAFALPGVTFIAAGTVSVEQIESHNVLARLPGSRHPDETIMVAAHWDAYGHGAPDAQGRTVRPGAYAAEPIYPLARTVANLTLDIELFHTIITELGNSRRWPG